MGVINFPEIFLFRTETKFIFRITFMKITFDTSAGYKTTKTEPNMFRECSFCWRCDSWQNGILFKPRHRAIPNEAKRKMHEDLHTAICIWSWRCKNCEKVSTKYFWDRARRRMMFNVKKENK